MESEIIDLESNINEANDLLYFLMCFSDSSFNPYYWICYLQKKGRQAGLQIARRGFQAYADMELDAVERERKRLKANENNEEVSPVNTYPSNLQDRTQREPRTPKNQEEELDSSFN